MKKKWIHALPFIVASLFLMPSNANSQNSNNNKSIMDLKNETDSLSYSLGLNVAKSLQSQGFDDINTDVFHTALRDVISGTELKIDESQANSIIQEIMKARQEKVGAVDKIAGEQFLEENKTRSEVTTTASGLQYEVIEKGQGTTSPAATDKVTVHYHGTLLDGTVFDSSVERGQTIDFPLNGVIPGWTEGLQLMKEGDKFKFFIPQNLAYGTKGAGGAIKPFMTLIFDVELIKVH